MHVLIIPSEHFITQSQPLAGIFQYHQAKALAKFGCKVGLLSVGYITPRYLLKKYKYIRKENIDNINIKREYKQLYFPHRYIPFNILKINYIKMADKLYNEYVKEFGQPDIIHAHNFLYAGIIANYLKNKHMINYIVTEHSSSFIRSKLSNAKITSIKNIAKNTSVITSVSNSFQKTLELYTNCNVQVLHNIVDDFFFQNKFIHKINNKFIFLSVASLDQNKNQELLIYSFAKIYKNKKSLLKIAGDGPLKNSLKKLCIDLDVENQVIFLGRINQKQVRDEMMNSDCFVLSSNYETFGVVLIEALACGLPLIATKCGGPEDIVNESNGILTDVGNQEELENAMLFMYENSKNYNQELLRQDARKRFGEKAFVENAKKYYKKGLNNVKY
jgi:glycosyltransferase involved in cell wall biosynthesis